MTAYILIYCEAADTKNNIILGGIINDSLIFMWEYSVN